MNRRERRARARTGRPAPVAGGLNTGANMPPKIPGQHRWALTMSWIITDTDAQRAVTRRPAKLDRDTLLGTIVACWDCKARITPISLAGGIVGSVCQGERPVSADDVESHGEAAVTGDDTDGDER